MVSCIFIHLYEYMYTRIYMYVYNVTFSVKILLRDDITTLDMGSDDPAI